MFQELTGTWQGGVSSYIKEDISHRFWQRFSAFRTQYEQLLNDNGLLLLLWIQWQCLGGFIFTIMSLIFRILPSIHKKTESSIILRYHCYFKLMKNVENRIGSNSQMKRHTVPCPESIVFKPPSRLSRHVWIPQLSLTHYHITLVWEASLFNELIVFGSVWIRFRMQ